METKAANEVAPMGLRLPTGAIIIRYQRSRSGFKKMFR